MKYLFNKELFNYWNKIYDFKVILSLDIECRETNEAGKI